MSQPFSPFSGSTELRARGVYLIDPNDQPPPPVGAQAAEVIDSTGRTIGFSWVVAEFADDRWMSGTWNWLDQKDPLDKKIDDLCRRLKIIP